jgi:hypothetical protein
MLSLCFIKQHAMMAYGLVEVQLHVYLTSASDEGEWLVSMNRRFGILLCTMS